MGFVGQFSNAMGASRDMKRKSSELQFQGQMARINGKMQKGKAYADAAGVEQAATLNLALDAQAQRGVRKRQSAAVASARVARSGSGFLLDQGTGSAAEDEVRVAYDTMVANMAQSSSIANLNEQQRAINMRRSGDVAQVIADIDAMGYESQARQYEIAAKAMRKSAQVGMIGGALGAAVGAYNGFSAGGALGALAGGVQGGNMSWDMGTTFNPLMAGYTVNAGDSWGNMLAMMSDSYNRRKVQPQQQPGVAKAGSVGNSWVGAGNNWYVGGRERS